MRRLLIAFAAALLVGPPSLARAQETSLGTYGFWGSDGFSTHFATIELFTNPFLLANNAKGVRLQGKSNWSGAGAFSDCGLGCVWNVNDFNLVLGSSDDYRHVDNTCYVYGAPAIPTFPMRYCGAGEKTWFNAPREWATNDAWMPQFVLVNIANQAAPGVPSAVRLSMVPEPSTYALMAAGLVALGVVARRRRER